jgi:hypothetical protein
MASGETYGVLTRAIQAGYAALYYVARTVWPADLNNSKEKASCN